MILNGVISSMEVSWDSGLSLEDVGSLVEMESMFEVLNVDILEISFLDFCVLVEIGCSLQLAVFLRVNYLGGEVA